MNSSKTSSKQSSKTASSAGSGIRLNRWLASCGLGSRRKMESLITSGRIAVNGQICQDLGVRIGKEDEVTLDGKPLQPAIQPMYLILNKPRGYVVTRTDEKQRQTVYDLLPPEAAHLNYAGRLDKNSEGLLLFTNDGELINQLTHPSFSIEKVYKVDVKPPLPYSAIRSLREGVVIEGGPTRSAGVYIKSRSEKGMSLKLVIREGRKRQIRQMIEAVGGKVIALRRLQFGTLTLKDLQPGCWRPLTPTEVRALRKLCKGKPKR